MFPPEVCDLQERQGWTRVREALSIEEGSQVGVALIGSVGVVKTEATRPASLLLNIKSAAQPQYNGVRKQLKLMFSHELFGKNKPKQWSFVAS